MKTILITLGILMGLISTRPSDSNFDFEKAWQQVEQLINEGLPQSALEKVEEIQKRAIEEKNDQQIVKSIIYIARLSITTDEKGIEKAILRLEKIVADAKAPVKQITASYLAELYQRYFDNYRWEISQRSEIAGDQGKDFRTWSTQQFLRTIEQWYLFSLEDKKSIRLDLAQYTVILNKFDTEAKSFRPTLYEVLADRAFEFFNNYDSYSNENEDSFQMDQEGYFEIADNFVSQSLPAKDLNSAKYKILKLYQEILATQITNKNEASLADYDLKRLQYIYEQATISNKEKIYLASLDKLANRHIGIEYYTEIISVLAGHIRGMQEDSLANVKVLKICEDAIKKYPNSTGAAKCQNIINEIKKPSIQLYGEQVYPSKQKLLFALDYNNISLVTVSTVKLDKSFESFNQRNQEEVIEYLKKAKKNKEQKLNLKASSTYNSQRLEFAHDVMAYGQYALLVHNKDNDIYQYLLFHISDLAYTSFFSGGNRTFVVSNRVSGKPEKDVKLTIFQQNYNPGSRNYDYVKNGEYVTNATGTVKMSDMVERNFNVVLSKGKDILDLKQFHYNYGKGGNEEYRFAEFYTDRSIYRPGQIIFFKAILLKNDLKQVPTLISNESVDVIFRDANYQEIARQNLKSNDFGSINGVFTIPIGRLNGNYIIETQSSKGIYGQKSVQVEEYKRPTFEVKTDPFIKEYELNDQISVTGFAQTFAGSMLDGAEVKYKVVRSARFPGWGWWWRMPAPSAEFIVKQGELTADGDGKFSFDFKAIPDLKLDKKDLPVFTYTIEVEVTDQRGETRITSTAISVGYTAYSLSSNLQGEKDVKDITKIKVDATSTNGQPIEVKGTLKISQLKEPSEVKVNKYWDGKIDFPLSNTIAEKYFPQYPTTKDVDFSSWPTLKQVFQSDFNTKDSIDIKKVYTAGVYKLELQSKDKNGKEITATQYLVVTDFSKSIFPKSDFLFSKLNQVTYEPGDELKINFGSAVKPIDVLIVVEKDGHLLLDKSVRVDKNGQVMLPVMEAYRGGINAKISYIIQNRKFEKSFFIDVPWSNKQLKIAYETFRDKTVPGSKEEYRIKISGLKQDKVAAEMVAAMYDASLDQFINHDWRSNFYPASYANIMFETAGFQMVTGRYYAYGNQNYVDVKTLILPSLMPLLDGYGYSGGRGDVLMMKSSRNGAPVPEAAMQQDGVVDESTNVNPAQKEGKDLPVNQKPKEDIPVRKNLKETVFFFPTLKTDSDGNVILSFTMNEALTKWRLMSFAHTKDFKTGYDERFIQTQKDLMVFPNAPRFLRDGDKLAFTSKVTNLSEGAIKGTTTIQIWDAISMVDITNELVKKATTLDIFLEKGRSQGVSWEIHVPESKYAAITYRITASAGDYTDAEEQTIPVVTNRMLVTESMPFWLKGNSTKTFSFNAFKNNVSKTRKDFKYTFEYTSNPIWYAVQALPYISETNNASTQAIVDKMYANALAGKIANAHPKIKAVFDQWKIKDKDALLSNLSKNEALKSALLEETPWVRQAMSEAEQKRNIAVLFDLNKLAEDKMTAINKLAERQLSNGGFPWLSGGRDNVYTTQNILENIGHLYHLGALEIDEPGLVNIINPGLKYMDDELVARYTKLKADIKKHGGNINDDHLDELSVHYLYIKTYFKHVNASPASKEARDYYYGQTKKYWQKRGLYTQAMIGLILFRNDDSLVKNIIKSLREKSFQSDELGMYWNEGNGFYWYQLPIERHALMVELFTEVETKKEEADRLKVWLLKNKQTNHWKTSKSTAAAIYALLLQGENGDISQWITEGVQPVIMIGQELVNTSTSQTESGTGYIKKAWTGGAIIKDMATIKVTNNNKSIAWGAAYYQYFEQLDQIKTFADTPLKLNKKLYKTVTTPKGDELVLISENTMLKPGDKIKIIIELRVDREMEYVHMKDMRASGLEPTNVISEYKYQGQLGYYETTKDLATHFYFTNLPKGTFVFEYPVRVVHKGDFSGGMASIECMYAPEFSSHSEGSRLVVK